MAYWPLWAALTPASALYAGILAVRARWWQTRARDAGVTTISVGNLTVGGNGKTPFTVFLASRLAHRGYRVGIVSRGYGRLSNGPGAALVSDGARIMLSPGEAGDESVMMARSFAGPIAVARRRVDGISLLARRAAIDIVILDDGFQHLRLRRDLDLILVNAARGFGNEWVLPAGPMREPLGAIGRADAVILMASGENAACAQAASDNAAFKGKPVMRAALRATSLVHAKNGEWRESQIAITGRRVAIVSGLGSPEGFHATVRALGAQISNTLDYPDHHDYSARDWKHIQDAAGGAQLLLTTEKDLVKLEKFCAGAVPMYALRVEAVMDESNEALLLSMVAERARRRGVVPATHQCAN
ncbi:MAG TPA: tetraacyldisaccharide 4'-kinase [Candidatus Binataceae bacterium]|nr:tetraacyldisaccharide 4'-kinase [Candidatus Binataceae bacterium]